MSEFLTEIGVTCQKCLESTIEVDREHQEVAALRTSSGKVFHAVRRIEAGDIAESLCGVRADEWQTAGGVI